MALSVCVDMFLLFVVVSVLSRGREGGHLKDGLSYLFSLFFLGGGGGKALSLQLIRAEEADHARIPRKSPSDNPRWGLAKHFLELPWPKQDVRA